MRSAKQPKASSSSKSTSNSSSASAPPPPSTQTSTSKSLKPKSPSPRSQKVGGNTDEDVSPGAVRFSAQICQDDIPKENAKEEKANSKHSSVGRLEAMRLKVERMRMEKRRSGDAKDGAPPNVENAPPAGSSLEGYKQRKTVMGLFGTEDDSYGAPEKKEENSDKLEVEPADIDASATTKKRVLAKSAGSAPTRRSIPSNPNRATPEELVAKAKNRTQNRKKHGSLGRYEAMRLKVGKMRQQAQANNPKRLSHAENDPPKENTPTSLSDSSSTAGMTQNEKMAMAAKKLMEMKSRTEQRKKRKEELRRKRMEAKKKNQDQLQGQLSVFMKVVSNLEPMLKRLEEEKAERNKALDEIRKKSDALKEGLTNGATQIKIMADALGQLLQEEELNRTKLSNIHASLKYLSADMMQTEGISIPSAPRRRLSYIPPEVLEINKPPPPPAAINVGAPPTGVPPPPPLPTPPALPAPARVTQRKQAARSIDGAEEGGSALLRQIRQGTTLRKVDQEQVAKERQEGMVSGSIEASLRETMKLALEIRKKAMEAQDDDEEDWSDSDEDDWFDEEDEQELQELLAA